MDAHHHLVKRERFVGGRAGTRFVARCQRWPLSGPWRDEPELLQPRPDRVWYESGDTGCPPTHIHHDSFEEAARCVCTMEDGDTITEKSRLMVQWIVSSNAPDFEIAMLSETQEILRAERLCVGKQAAGGKGE